MPGGTPWLTDEPVWFEPPTGELYRVHPGVFDAALPNPASRARFALPGTHAMFYAADSLEGALWEALLRYTVIGRKGLCEFPTAKLKGQVVSRVRFKAARSRLLPLSRPGLQHLFPDGDSAAVQAVKFLTTTPDHTATHAEAAELHACLLGLTPPIEDMPMLSWKSRQFEDSTVYLSYHRHGAPSGWEHVGASQSLDTPAGMALIQAALGRHKFEWTPLNTLPTHVINDSAV
ncbi:hypothetical protein QE447_003714 [Stenotrophomonas sp. SORGH_AS282]|jgi:hypothetical protein|nr:hypothetical protein [Stenotrophomonas sp. SORGH_AS_0282]MDQ1191211.1 hypothetical protein [Stenotrophomonas sp. SORGH_AS_0282]